MNNFPEEDPCVVGHNIIMSNTMARAVARTHSTEPHTPQEQTQEQTHEQLQEQEQARDAQRPQAGDVQQWPAQPRDPQPQLWMDQNDQDRLLPGVVVARARCEDEDPLPFPGLCFGFS